MTHTLSTGPTLRWYSDDFLVRLMSERDFVSAESSEPSDVADRLPIKTLKFGSAALGLVADARRHEELSVQRSKAFYDRDLVVFGARTRSLWALDVLVGRLTGFALDWSAFRAALVEAADGSVDSESSFGRVAPDKLYEVSQLLHERSLDPEAERALLLLIANRLGAGASLAKESFEPFVERLLQAGLAEAARPLIARVPAKTWMRHAFNIELEHPRHGGSFTRMLSLFNEPYRRLGLESIELSGEGATPFQRLTARPFLAAPPGPLVTVIMTSWSPGPEILTAVRSIINQTYENWELIVTDDASSADADEILNQIQELDPRIIVLRNELNAGTYVRRNEAIQSARGEFVTMQDSDDWSHPHRLEIQVRDLVATPARLANVVHASRVTNDFSVVSNRGARLFLAEPSLMFRRAAVTSAIGYYDSVRKSADTEFRKRLEAVTGKPVPVLVEAAPLMVMLADQGSLSGADFGTNIWNHPDRLIYWSATRRYLERIKSGAQDPHLPFPQIERAFHAPGRWRDATPVSVDLLVVLDGRQFADYTDFHAMVIEEIRAAANSGKTVAVAQSDAIRGPRGMAFFPAPLQELVDAGVIARVGAAEAVSASTVIVRHSVAAQGHPNLPWQVETSDVVVVEDASGGDVRGETVAKSDVIETVTAWFGVEPRWVVAPPVLPTSRVGSCSIVDGTIRIVLETAVPSLVRAIRVASDGRSFDVPPVVSGATSLIATVPMNKFDSGEWHVTVESDDGGGRVVSQNCPVSQSAVISNSGTGILVRTESGALRLLSEKSSDGHPSRGEFAAAQLSAAVSKASVIDERVELTVHVVDSAKLIAVYALRQVEQGLVRRRDFTRSAAADGGSRWHRPLDKFADAKWSLLGSFQTPLGVVEYPIAMKPAAIEGSDGWHPYVLNDGRLLVTQARTSRSTSLTNYVRAKVGQISRRGSAGSDSGLGTSTFMFDERHSVSRLKQKPLVSVVMPVYNVEPYLDAAVASVLEQDFSDLELILIDDASTDNGRRIMAEYWSRDPRVRVFGLDHNTLGGAGVPSNIGIRAALGTYVAFADSDDHVTPAGLAALVKLAEAQSAEIVIGGFRTFTGKWKEGKESYDHKVLGALPHNEVISASAYPSLFELSPVPWRKLYRRDFLETNGILFPEGDYFYEDNPLHWFVLSRAHRVVVCDEVISFHRQEREGQTMSAQAYKLGAFINHANTILGFLEETHDEHRDALFEAFFGYLDRSNWTVGRQTQPIAASLIRRGLGDVYERTKRAAPTAQVPPLVRSRLSTYHSAYPDVDLTVVIPVFNSADLVGQTLDSVLAIEGLNFNVLLVDDGSSDESLSVMRRYESEHSNVHVFAQGNRGAGRARNSVIPLCTGRFTYFLDADDVVDAVALVSAVKKADVTGDDLLFVKYGIEFADEGRTQGMFGSDKSIWEQVGTASDNDDMQVLAARLINYPWNRIIRTSLLHDANIFFGPTVVHNDVLFHWHSVASAQRIGFHDVQVCLHRKFASRAQVTNISDARRMAVLEALRGAHERISPLPSYANIRPEWTNLTVHLLGWAKERVPAELVPTYEKRRAELVSSVEAR